MALYEVTPKGGQARLIVAKTRAGARSFAAKDSIEVVKCTPQRAHVLAARGVKMETAIEDERGE
jgi:hypothetical protein